MTDIPLQKYVVTRFAEETVCGFCGWPMWIGDTTFLDEEVDETFCGLICANKFRDYPDQINDTGGNGLWN